MSIRVLALSFCLMTLICNAYAGLSEGIIAYQHGDYTQALQELRPVAEQGFALAQFTLGDMYLQGQGVYKDAKEAAWWFLLAAKLDYPSAQRRLGSLYAEGTGVPQDLREAVAWYLKAANQGDLESKYALATMYKLGQGVPQNDSEGEWWQANAEQQVQMEARLKESQERPPLPESHAAEELAWFQKEAQMGYPLAQYNLGLMYELGRNVPQNDREALRWYRQAAEKRFALAQYRLGMMYAQGRAVPRLTTVAFALFDLSSDIDIQATLAREQTSFEMNEAEIAEATKLAQRLRQKTSLLKVLDTYLKTP